jgi:ABC-type Zn uptake system ZnuABC Zn-binding protein ZnuA
MRENWPDPDDMEPSELERMLDSDLWHYNDKELSNLIAWLTKLRAALQKQDEQEQALLAGLKQKEGDGEKLTANERAWMAKLDPRT